VRNAQYETNGYWFGGLADRPPAATSAACAATSRRMMTGLDLILMPGGRRAVVLADGEPPPRLLAAHLAIAGLFSARTRRAGPTPGCRVGGGRGRPRHPRRDVRDVPPAQVVRHAAGHDRRGSCAGGLPRSRAGRGAACSTALQRAAAGTLGRPAAAAAAAR
jgi:hypothetical protein